jgi:hypothetical protein
VNKTASDPAGRDFSASQNGGAHPISDRTKIYNFTMVNHSLRSSKTDFRAAVVLNNFGISLLEKNCYKQAMETLRDALSLVREQAASKSATSCSAAERKMELARQRLANPQPCKRRPMVLLEVLTNSLSSESLSKVLGEGPPCSTCFPVRIDQLEEISSSDFKCALILQNIGIAYLCMSKTSNKRSATIRYNHSAVRLFRVSHFLLIKNLQQCQGSSRAQLPELLYGTAIVLNGLIRTLQESSRAPEAKNLHSQLARLRTAIHDVEGSRDLFGLVPKAAAAA